MPLISPRLDDRDFAVLMEQARAYIKSHCPEWSDLSVHDPGIILAEVFAHLTETLLYRVNRIPEKVYVELLKLVGVMVQPPIAAGVTIELTLSSPAEVAVEVPDATVLTAAGGGGEPIRFLTARPARIAPGATTATLTAYHMSAVDGELVGAGSGQPGQVLRLARAPVVAPIREVLTDGSALDVPTLLVGVETSADLIGDAPGREFGGKAFRFWREVDTFANVEPSDPYVFVADRMSGLVCFAPAARLRQGGALDEAPVSLAATPPLGAEIRAWYRTGGGPAGNVVAGSLDLGDLKLRSAALGDRKLSVKQKERATGGRSGETVANALVRGPVELRVLDRAVTPRDVEVLALRASRDVARVLAFPARKLWSHARPGTAEVLIVPALPETAAPRAVVRRSDLEAEEREETRRKVARALSDCTPIGTSCDVKWARYKKVRVKARVVAHRGEDKEQLKARVERRLHATINPLPAGGSGGWGFGTHLRISRIYDIILAEPGVSYVDQVRFTVDEAPRNVVDLAADPSQARTWYALTDLALFRTMNDGDSWELLRTFEGVSAATVGGFSKRFVSRHPSFPGLLAVSVQTDAKQPEHPRSRIYWSRDAGETWMDGPELALVHGIAWTDRGGAPWLAMATQVGLYQVKPEPKATPDQIKLTGGEATQVVHTVASTVTARGTRIVAVAPAGGNAVLVSFEGGAPNSFKAFPFTEPVGALELAAVGTRTVLWMATRGAKSGAYRVDLFDEGGTFSQAAQAFVTGWNDAGICQSLAFSLSNNEARVFAATGRGGVLWIDPIKNDAAWRATPAAQSGLPLETRDGVTTFDRVASVAAFGGLLLAGGGKGVFRTSTLERYENVSSVVHDETVHLPETWLFCSDTHDVEVVYEHEA